MFKLLVLLLLVNCVLAEKEETSEICNEMFEPHGANILHCCDFPMAQNEIAKCRLVCRNGNDDNKCICRNCLKENDYVPRDKDQYLKLYDQNINETFTADEKKNWLLLMSKSFDYCKHLIDIVNGTDECQFPKYYEKMIICMWQQNFVNCPKSSIASSEKCNATRKFIKEQETCGTKYEDIFVIDSSIFDQDAKLDNKCQEKFKEAELKTKNCVYSPPEMIPPEDVYNDCQKQCSSKACCMAPCFLNATSVESFSKKIVKDKINEFYKNYYLEDGMEPKSLHGIWKPVIKNSFDICYDIASKVTGTRICNIRLKLDSLRSCMRQELFLNAPTSLIKDPDQFEKIKTFIANEAKCGQKFGEKFIINWSFWKY